MLGQRARAERDDRARWRPRELLRGRRHTLWRRRAESVKKEIWRCARADEGVGTCSGFGSWAKQTSAAGCAGGPVSVIYCPKCPKQIAEPFHLMQPQLQLRGNGRRRRSDTHDTQDTQDTKGAGRALPPVLSSSSQPRRSLRAASRISISARSRGFRRAALSWPSSSSARPKARFGTARENPVWTIGTLPTAWRPLVDVMRCTHGHGRPSPTSAPPFPSSRCTPAVPTARLELVLMRPRRCALHHPTLQRPADATRACTRC